MKILTSSFPTKDCSIIRRIDWLKNVSAFKLHRFLGGRNLLADDHWQPEVHTIDA